MGSAYGFGGIGKIIGPMGLALIVGSSNYLKPDVPLPQIPVAFVYLGCWFLMAGAVYYFLGIETRGKSIEQIDKELAAGLAWSIRRYRFSGDCLGHVDFNFCRHGRRPERGLARRSGPRSRGGRFRRDREHAPAAAGAARQTA
jgi:hypothetical protein